MTHEKDGPFISTVRNVQINTGRLKKKKKGKEKKKNL